MGPRLSLRVLRLVHVSSPALHRHAGVASSCAPRLVIIVAPCCAFMSLSGQVRSRRHKGVYLVAPAGSTREGFERTPVLP